MSSAILFLGADPTGGTFSIEEEFRLIETELTRSGRDAFTIESDLNVEPREIQRLLNQYEPKLLHFSGHVTEAGELVLIDQAGKGSIVPNSVLARIFAGRRKPIRCILLNACNGDALAPTLRNAAEVVIAMKGMVTVRSAQAFSVRFYETLASGLSVQEAYDQGLIECELAGFSGELSASLDEREPGLAQKMVFTNETPPPVPTRKKIRTPDKQSSRGDIFISYAHEDEEWMSRLSVMLKPLERSIGVNAWDDRRIAASASWRNEIDAALSRARIAVLLVSPSFLASEFIYHKELPIILAARARGELDLLWCYLAPCMVNETKLSEIQAAHSPMKPLVSMNEGEQDSALLQVAMRASEILRG